MASRREHVGSVSQPPATCVSAVVFTVKVAALAGAASANGQGQAEQDDALQVFGTSQCY